MNGSRKDAGNVTDPNTIFMTRKNLVFVLLSSWLMLASPSAWPQQLLTIRNDAYQITVPARLNAKSVLSITKGNLRLLIRPELLLLQKQATSETEKATSAGAATSPQQAFSRKEAATTLGTVTGMLFNLVPQFSDAYIFSDATEKTLKQVTLRYRLGNES